MVDTAQMYEKANKVATLMKNLTTFTELVVAFQDFVDTTPKLFDDCEISVSKYLPINLTNQSNCLRSV